MAALPPRDQVPPSAFKIQHSSPLDSLVRRTSSRKAKVAAATSDAAHRPPHPTVATDHASLVESHPHQHESPSTPPRQLLKQNSHLSPSSPILHSRFTRDSVATESEDNSSYLDRSRVSVDSRNVYQDSELEYRYYDTDSVYSDATASPVLRDSWQSAATADTFRPSSHIAAIDNSPHLSTNPQHQVPLSQPSTPMSSVPTVVVSSPTPEARTSDSRGHAGRAPIIRSVTSNFSRPVRSPPESAGLPPPPPVDEEQKRRVLERNMKRNPSPISPSLRNQASTSNISGTASSSIYSRSSSPNALTRIPSPSMYSSQSSAVPDPYSLNMNGSAPHLAPYAASQPQPSVRTGSPASLYSNYSYYPFDSAAPSPISSEFDPQRGPQRVVQQNSRSQPYTQNHLHSLPGNPAANHTGSPKASGIEGVLTDANASTPQDFLQLGIQHHEANRLKESAICFERSAKEQGGCGVGMLMWGLALRHGWGCDKNEKMGFKWLRKAAEHAVVDLESARAGGGVDKSALQTELVLAIYEVGQCFFHGWGVPKDQKMAVSYYAVAARLGDADAQMDLAFCLTNGKGCKKDRKEAAKWYRAAVAQGQSDIGLAWIYKEKYQ